MKILWTKKVEVNIFSSYFFTIFSLIFGRPEASLDRLVLKLVFYVIWKQNNKIKATKPKIAEGYHKNYARRKEKNSKNSNFTFSKLLHRSNAWIVSPNYCFKMLIRSWITRLKQKNRKSHKSTTKILAIERVQLSFLSFFLLLKTAAQEEGFDYLSRLLL